MKTVLVVDDSPDARDLTAAIVRSAGYGMQEAANGQEALDALDRMTVEPCLILLDLTMPVMDGWAFLAALGSRRSFTARVPIVVVSAVADHPVDGAWMLIPKPASPQELRQLILDVCGPP